MRDCWLYRHNIRFVLSLSDIDGAAVRKMYGYVCDYCCNFIYYTHARRRKGFRTVISKKGRELHYCSINCHMKHRPKHVLGDDKRIDDE